MPQEEQKAEQIKCINDLCALYRIHVDEVQLISVEASADDDLDLRCRGINRAIHDRSDDHAYQVVQIRFKSFLFLVLGNYLHLR